MNENKYIINRPVTICGESKYYSVKKDEIKKGKWYVVAVSFKPNNPIYTYIMNTSLFKEYEIDEDMYVDLYGHLEDDRQSVKLKSLNYLKIIEEIKSMMS